uniref:Reverse transcriptase domain-containing protein n=2 Tax=Caenorhabditis japonica TaxID=281687 RepID=A0A8R1E4M2_CAEJA
MGLASTLYSEEQAQLDIMIQLGFSTLQMSRGITRLRCCVRNYVRDTMAHGSEKPTGRPRILNDRDEQSVVSQLSWQHPKEHEDNYKPLARNEMRINGHNITHLRFVDDIVLVANNPRTASQIIQELVEICGKVGLQINSKKTKVIRNGFASKSPVEIPHNNVNIRIENAKEYVYIVRLLSRIGAGEAAEQHGLRSTKSRTPQMPCFALRLFDSIVLPALTYGSEVWIFTKTLVERVSEKKDL